MPTLGLVRQPRARFWGRMAMADLPNTVLLNWLDHPNDGEPGELMPGIFWESFSALGLTHILFGVNASDTPEPAYRRITPQLAIADDATSFLQAFDIDGLDCWQADQCFMGLQSGTLPDASDPALAAWLPYWTQKGAAMGPPPASLPDQIPLAVKVHEGEDAAWAFAIANTADTLTKFISAVGLAATGMGVVISEPEERSLIDPSLWARFGPVD